MYFKDQSIIQIWKPMELNFEGLKMQKWDVPMDSAQRVDKKSGIISLFIMFTLRVMVIKMSKMSHFFVSSDDDSKKSFSLGKTMKCIWIILFSSFRKYGLLYSELPLARCQLLKIQDFGIFCWFWSFFGISILNI